MLSIGGQDRFNPGKVHSYNDIMVQNNHRRL